MEQEGVVSVWAGFFKDEASLMAYAAEDGYDSEGNEKISPFNQDFFGGSTLWPFDPDFWERNLVEPTMDAVALVEPFSEGITIGEGLKELFPQGLKKLCNAAILVYDYKYEPEEIVLNPNAPVIFLGAVSCDLT